MTSTKNEHESIQLDGGPLGLLAFSRREDRYHHQWSFPESAVRISSVESCDDSLWPCSPPLQQIHSQSFADGREVIFGVGMAGRGHWSASYTLVPDLKCWIVELACRSSVPAERLDSTYQLEGWSYDETETGEYLLDKTHRIALEAITPSTASRAEDAKIVFSPAQVGDQASTIQWAFRLKVG